MRNEPNEIAKKKGRFAVSLLKFNKLRGGYPDVVVSVVEGDDDPLFYSSMYSRLGVENPDVFFIANGKDNVFALRDHLERSPEAARSGFNTFFVDKDYDGTKGWRGGSDLYVTPTYSLENLLVCRTAMRSLLVSDFRLGTVECIGDVDRLLEKFDSLLVDYTAALEEVNALLHWVRLKEQAGTKVTQGTIEKNEEKYATLRFSDLAVRKQASGVALAALLKLSINLDDADLSETREEFRALVPKMDWRGKFIFYLFRKFIAALVEDRNSEVSVHFSQGKGKVSLDSTGRGLVRTMASSCEIPACLRDFAQNRALEIARWRASAVAA